MRFTTITVLALVILQAANTHRILKLRDNVDDCYTAYQSVKTAVPEVVDAVNKQDFVTAISVVTTKIVPQFQPMAAGGLQCYERIAGDYLGQQCVDHVVKFAEDVQKYMASKNPTDLITAIADFTAGMQDCQGKKLAFVLKDNVDDCYTAFQTVKAAVPDVVSAVQKQDYLTAVTVVMTRVVPQIQPIQAGGMQCYERVAGDFVGQQCVSSVEKFVQDIQKYMSSKNMADLLAAVADFTTGMQNCQNHKLFLGDVNCSDELNSVINAVPTVVDHIKSQNFLALVGDLTTLKPHIDNISNSCVTSSDACTTLQNNVMQNLNDILGDVQKNSDKATVEGHGKSLADNLFDWRAQCFKA